MANEPRIRVLVVDDHPVTRDGVRAGLERDGRAVVVAEAADAEAACRLADSTRPDVALVDLRLARGDGVEVIRYLREHRPETRILVLSQADPDEIVAAVRAGADGAVDKAATSAELVSAVHAVRSGPVLPPELAAHLISEMRVGPRPLTQREHDILRCLAKGYDNREIAQELGISIRTVNRHLENIRAKLDRNRRSELIRLARERHPH